MRQGQHIRRATGTQPGERRQGRNWPTFSADNSSGRPAACAMHAALPSPVSPSPCSRMTLPVWRPSAGWRMTGPKANMARGGGGGAGDVVAAASPAAWMSHDPEAAPLSAPAPQVEGRLADRTTSEQNRQPRAAQTMAVTLALVIRSGCAAATLGPSPCCALLRAGDAPPGGRLRRS